MLHLLQEDAVVEPEHMLSRGLWEDITLPALKKVGVFKLCTGPPASGLVFFSSLTNKSLNQAAHCQCIPLMRNACSCWLLCSVADGLGVCDSIGFELCAHNAYIICVLQYRNTTAQFEHQIKICLPSHQRLFLH